MGAPLDAQSLILNSSKGNPGQMEKDNINNPLSDDTFKAPQSIADQVYSLLKKKIFDQEILAGERLREVSLSESLNISRTPVREALRLLQKDGLVERIPKGGVKVTQLSINDLEEIIALRKMIETYAAELACDRITDKEINELEFVMQKAEKKIIAEQEGEAIDINEFSALNSEFHDTLCNSAHSPYISKILEIVQIPNLRLRPLSLEDKKHRIRGVKEHKEMIELIKSKDKKRLRKLIIKHIEDVNDVLKKNISSHKR